MKVTLTATARTHAPAKAWTAAAFMIQTVELPPDAVDTVDTRIAFLSPANLKAVNDAALEGKTEVDLDVAETAAARASTHGPGPQRKTRDTRHPIQAKAPEAPSRDSERHPKE